MVVTLARDLHTCHTRWFESGGHVLEIYTPRWCESGGHEIYTLVTPGGVSQVVTC